MGLTIHFEKNPPDAIEQWLGTEARYIIGTFSKAASLQIIYGDDANQVINDCKNLGENIVGSITMVLTNNFQKLYSTVVSLRNGNRFFLNDKYALLENDDAQKTVDALIEEDSPRVFRVINK
jgi:hypothetical protein